jgi:adenosine deaminase
MPASRSCRLVVLIIAAFSFPAVAQAPAHKTSRSIDTEKRTAQYFESVRNQPSLLMDFLRRMPKGADLHNHLSGAIYAESFIRWAVQDNLCINRTSSTFVACEPGKDFVPAAAAYSDVGLYSQLLDAFSMRGWMPARESGHDHFFATFGKFGAATSNHTADMLAEVRSRAARENVEYMELMFNPDGGNAAALGKKLGWTNDLANMREQLLAAGLKDVVRAASKSLDEIESRENLEMHCGAPQPDPGCAVHVRYLYQVARGLPREQVFAQILSGFEMASTDRRVVGLNLVMAEDGFVPVHDFNLHMQMIDYLHGLYPQVHVTLHAGELTPQLVPPEEMFHIRASVEKGHAERIGHGVDVMREPDPDGLLKEMAARHVLVEICLTSNDVILGVSGSRHPLPMYLKYGVPFALATDDEGVSRSSMTQEFQRAVETYQFTYPELKKIVRASMSYSFLPGKSLWREAPNCVPESLPSGKRPSARCAAVLKDNEKAQAEADLEAAFASFERQFATIAVPSAKSRSRPAGQ